MTSLTKGVYIVAAKRTPFGTFGGKFAKTSTTDLQVTAAKAALLSGNVPPEAVDSVVIGNVLMCSTPDGYYLPRHVLLKSGIPLYKTALGVNRLNGSGFQSIINGAQDIILGVSNIVLTGGADNMSLAPHIVRGIRFGVPLGGKLEMEDSLWTGLFDSYIKFSMGQTAENLAEKYNLTRTEVDEFAVRSQILWKKANDEGVFKSELAPVTIVYKNKEIVVFEDEHPKSQTTLEGLAKLPTTFKKNGVVTAGNASGIGDGAGAVIVANEAAIKQHNLTPLARLVGYSIVGVEPEIMGIGCVPVIKDLLKAAGKTLNDIDLVEINEAFSAQTLSCQKELKLDMEKLNVNGGGIAIGHPLAASGSRITTHLVHELRRKNLKYGIGSACIGGGQGIALLLEKV